MVAVTSVWFKILSVQLRVLLYGFGYFRAVVIPSVQLQLLPCGFDFFQCGCDYLRVVSDTSVWFWIPSLRLRFLSCGFDYFLVLPLLPCSCGCFRVISDTLHAIVVTSMQLGLFCVVAVASLWFWILSV